MPAPISSHVLDAAAYPHIYQLVAEHADRGTLCTLLRVSTWSRDLAIPILYDTVVEPLSAVLSHLPSSLTHISYEDIPPKAREQIDKHIRSFTQSPHLEFMENIVIRRPKIWAEFCARMSPPPSPLERGEDTVTMIQVESSSTAREGNGHVGGSSGGEGLGEVDVMAVDDDSVSDLESISSDEGSTARGNPAGWTRFSYIFTLASLFPSRRLILYIPESTGIDIHALTKAAV